MPAMFVEQWPQVGLEVVLIVVTAVAAYLAVRIAAAAAVRHLIARRGTDADRGNLSRVELERRVTTLGDLLVTIAAAVIVVVAVLMVLQAFNVDIGPAVASLGIAGLAIGFGAQALIRDWLAGVFIVAENQFNYGEQVRIAGVEGVVEDFSLRRTMLRDADGTVHHVPNGQIIVASNLSRGRPAAQPGSDDADDSSADTETPPESG
jgi:small conductance mechanosensitive channel